MSPMLVRAMVGAVAVLAMSYSVLHAEDLPLVKVDKVVVGAYQANCWLVWDPASGEGVLIDPGAEPKKIMALIEKNKVTVKAIVLTHEHADHLGAAIRVMEQIDVPLYRHPDQLGKWGAATIAKTFPDRVRDLKDGDTLKAGALTFAVIHTPGHSPGSVCLYGEGLLFTGDLLFKGSMGRYDLTGGSLATIQASLKKVLALAPDDTRVLPGHGPETTIGAERKTNPYLQFEKGN